MNLLDMSFMADGGIWGGAIYGASSCTMGILARLYLPTF